MCFSPEKSACINKNNHNSFWHDLRTRRNIFTSDLCNQLKDINIYRKNIHYITSQVFTKPYHGRPHKMLCLATYRSI